MLLTQVGWERLPTFAIGLHLGTIMIAQPRPPCCIILVSNTHIYKCEVHHIGSESVHIGGRVPDMREASVFIMALTVFPEFLGPYKIVSVGFAMKSSRYHLFDLRLEESTA